MKRIFFSNKKLTILQIYEKLRFSTRNFNLQTLLRSQIIRYVIDVCIHNIFPTKTA